MSAAHTDPAPRRTESFESLKDARYIVLTTFRRDGTPVPTPVCSAYADGSIYSSTGSDAGKVKRIRRDPCVTIAACDVRGRVLGPSYAAVAEILTGAAAERATRLKEARNRLARLRRVVETRLRGRTFVGLALRPAPGAAPGPKQTTSPSTETDP